MKRAPGVASGTAGKALQAAVITLTLAATLAAVPRSAHPQPPPERRADAASILPALAAARAKLGKRTLERLGEAITTRGKVRIMVGLGTRDEPMARLRGLRARSPETRRARRAAIARLQNRLERVPGLAAARRLHRFRDVPFVTLEVDRDALERIAGLADVESIREDRLLRLSLDGSGPQIGADVANAEGFAGSGKAVAIIDAGFETDHPSFTGRVVAEACFSTTSTSDNAVTLCPDGENPSGADRQVGPGAAINCDDMLGCDHGTHVAGIAAGGYGDYTGVAPEADIIVVQAFSRLTGIVECGFLPPCLSAFTSDVVRALEHVYSIRDTYDIAAVNMSLGGEAYSSAAECEAQYPALTTVIDNLRAEGIATVVASGNEYTLGALATPSCISSAFSVGAVDGADFVADFSNGADFLDVLAPGYGIVSTVPGGGYAGKDGTSMAAPHVAGAVAALASAAPEAGPDELLATITATGVPVEDWRTGIVTPRVQVDAAAFALTADDLDRLRFGLSPLASGAGESSWIGHAGDGSGRVFIAERAGVLRVLDGGTLDPAPFLDIRGQVACCDRDGLTAVAFHPAYTVNGRVFVAYVSPGERLVVAEHYAAPGSASADPGSGIELLSVPIPADGHAGGGLAFGADGYLYVGVGDGAPDGDPQPTAGDPSTLLGKLLRIDVDSAAPYVPIDNPFVGDPLVSDEIWALGLRDVRHLAVDPASGSLYITDAGESYEEVEVEPAAAPGGADYGWDVMEGDACRVDPLCDTTGLALPAGGYPHGYDCAAVGGGVYRGTAHPLLQGTYLYGDSCSGLVRGLRHNGEAWEQVEMVSTPLAIAAIGRDESGEIYLADVGGTIYQVVPTSLSVTSTNLPTALIGESWAATLQASGGTAPYSWSVTTALPDGVVLDADLGTLSGVPTEAFDDLIVVRVEDATFARAERRLRLTVVPPPLQVVTTTLPRGAVGESYAAALEGYGGAAPYTWSHDAGELPPGIVLAPDGTLSGTPTAGGSFAPQVTVTDSGGRQAGRTLTLDVLGPEIALAVGTLDETEYGHAYGTDAHEVGLPVTFTGSPGTLYLHVLGYDVDYADEVEVLLNDQPFAFLRAGPSDGYNAGDVFEIAPTAQLSGTNRLHFVQARSPGFTWGVTQLLLSTEPSATVVSTLSAPAGTLGAPYALAMQANGGIAPYTWRVSAGALPPGVTLDAQSGLLSGTPSAQGVYGFSIEARDTQGLSHAVPLTIEVLGPSGTVEVALVPDDGPDAGQYGYNYGSGVHERDLYVTFDGTGTDLTLSVIGYDIDYPDEVSVSLNGTPLGYLSVGPNDALNAGDVFALPGALQAIGRNEIVFHQASSGWTWGVTGLSLASGPLPLEVATTALPNAEVDADYTAQLSASGGVEPYLWSLTGGALPAGLALDPNGMVSGRPSAEGVGAFTVEVSDASGRTAGAGFEIVVEPEREVRLVIGEPDTGAYGNGYGSNLHPNELVSSFDGTSDFLVLSVTGYDIDAADEIAVELNGAHIGYLSSGPNNGLNSGDTFEIPAAAQLPSARNEIVFRQTTPGFIWGVTGLALEVAPVPLEIVTESLPESTLGSVYVATLAAAGGEAPYAWRIASGTLPAGLVFDGVAGEVSGTPTVQGAYDLELELSDAAGNAITKAYTLVALAPDGSLGVSLVPGVRHDGQYGAGYGTNRNPQTLVAHFEGSGADMRFEATGYDIDTGDEVAVELDGTPIGYLGTGPNEGLNAGDEFYLPASSVPAGPHEIVFRQQVAGWTWGVTSLLVEEGVVPLAIATADLPEATEGAPYAVALGATGGAPPYDWALVSGQLPSGLSLDAAGNLAGLTAAQGAYSLTVGVTDASGTTETRTLELLALDPDGTLGVTLLPGVQQSGQYGHQYGTNRNRTLLLSRFEAGTGDMTLWVTGFDIDAADEVAVELNGSPIGYLSVGPNEGDNAGDLFILPADDLLSGTNELAFRQLTPGFKWGVADLLLEEAAAALALAADPLPTAVYEEAYDVALLAIGGLAPFEWSVTAGSLPGGLTLDQDGVISAIPTTHGIHQFTVQVSDDAGRVASQGFEIVVYGSDGTMAVTLLPDVPSAGEYGWKYGSNLNRETLQIYFDGDGTTAWLDLTGHDIDFADEVEVSLNDVTLGYLSTGPNNGFNAGDSFELPVSDQVLGENVIILRQKVSGWKWGVRDLVLSR